MRLEQHPHGGENHRTPCRSLGKEPRASQFQVVDHGPGIPEESRSKLFDAFYSTKSEGMGMGLNICRSIAELHGGELRMDPTPGGGPPSPSLSRSSKKLSHTRHPLVKIAHNKD